MCYLFIEHLEQRSGARAAATGVRLVLGTIVVFVEYFMQAKKIVTGGSTGRICVAVSPLFVYLFYCSRKFQRKLCCTQHICQHLGTQTVFGFPTTGGDQHQKHTQFEHSQRKEHTQTQYAHF